MRIRRHKMNIHAVGEGEGEEEVLEYPNGPLTPLLIES